MKGPSIPETTLISRVRCPADDLDYVLVHRESDASAQNKPCKSRCGTGPESKDAFLCEDAVCTVEGVSILRPGFEALHSSFDDVQRHSCIYSNEPSDGTNPKSDGAGQCLSRPGDPEHELLESGIGRESDGRISALAHHHWE